MAGAKAGQSSPSRSGGERDLGQVGRVYFRGHDIREPSVRSLASASQDRFGAAAAPDWWSIHLARRRQHAHVLEREKAAVVGGCLAAPQLAQHRDAFREASDPLIDRHTAASYSLGNSPPTPTPKMSRPSVR